MTRKQIDQSREARLWISQVIVPAVVAGSVVWGNPEVRTFVKTKYAGLKKGVSKQIQKFKKGKES